MAVIRNQMEFSYSIRAVSRVKTYQVPDLSKQSKNLWCIRATNSSWLSPGKELTMNGFGKTKVPIKMSERLAAVLEQMSVTIQSLSRCPLQYLIFIFKKLVEIFGHCRNNTTFVEILHMRNLLIFSIGIIVFALSSWGCMKLVTWQWNNLHGHGGTVTNLFFVVLVTLCFIVTVFVSIVGGHVLGSELYKLYNNIRRNEVKSYLHIQ